MAADPLKALRDAIHSGPDGVLPVRERIQLLRDAIKQAVPDCKENTNIPNAIFEDDWDEDGPAQHEGFLRSILQSYRDTKDTPWDQTLVASTEKQKRILEKFVDGVKVEDLFEGFDFDSTRGTREELMRMRDGRREGVGGHGNEGGFFTRLFKGCFGGGRRVDVGLWEDVGKTKALEVGLDAIWDEAVC